MGLFPTKVALRSFASPPRERHLELMVDTGALFTWVESSILEELGIAPVESSDFQTITGALIRRRLGYAVVAWDGRTGPIYVVFGEPGDISVLGATALESLRVAADPIHKILVPVVAPAFPAVAQASACASGLRRL
jgi:predicted aspartyl protease